MNIEKWQKAVIHLEGAADSLSPEEIIERYRSQNSIDQISLPSRDIRFRGTAIYYADETGRYLLTARHVLRDEDCARRLVVHQMPDWVKKIKSHEELQAEVDRWIFNIIFRVPSLDEYLAGNRPINGMDFLMNLQAGVPSMTPYTFSAPDLDLAVISLNQHVTKLFADSLDKAGYLPISAEDLAITIPSTGDKIFAAGYPESTSVLGSRPLSRAEQVWASDGVSQPVLSFGHIGMSHSMLPYFWADISAYPGNSGGPVVSDGKLVGIVSAQASVDQSRIPFAKVIRAELLKDLISEQALKDKQWPN